MEVEGSSKKMIATQEEMAAARVPLAYRDQCAHLLIPLNKCRQAEYYLPWKRSARRRPSSSRASSSRPSLSSPNPPTLSSLFSSSFLSSAAQRELKHGCFW
ncbi:hypothetical protein NL676_031869 [Syzygium grande]|nr:hypothetical protein NL676_031869 [Syzygium grande]